MMASVAIRNGEQVDNSVDDHKGGMVIAVFPKS
jgi:hypothetical protein